MLPIVVHWTNGLKGSKHVGCALKRAGCSLHKYTWSVFLTLDKNFPSGPENTENSRVANVIVNFLIIPLLNRVN